MVDESEVCSRLKTFDITKAAGYDNIPPKVIKLGAESLAGQVTSQIYMCIEICTFPEMLKCAEVMPACKKGDVHDKTSYRPISILPALSKVFGGNIIDQLRPFFRQCIFAIFVWFRKNHNCHDVLIRFFVSGPWIIIAHTERY